ncbi:4a4962d4-3974-4f62-8c54-b3daefabb939 [Thermothielavioides terrestris]|uniref:4a4962d4-3974-4f62-8c54-b3daefabb939 n=1 Tax=Thermothielavioides terrestris TaxID=2587410 RepID=A0A3S4BL80_9PEZI|nr:4a4962d4-3974-4f62-8c54-b3daefabb939 [Thermothielavioides terrestris]
MAPLRSLAAAALLFLATHAHFILNLPPSLEGGNMQESLEPNAPCGGGSPDLASNTATDFHVDGDAISVQLGHPQANFLFRATLDSHAAGNWTQLFPIVQQTTRGNFCEPIVTAPKDWAGKKGFIGVVCDGPDGLLFQCAAVNFVTGTNTAAGSTCNNGTGVTAAFVADKALSTLVGTSASNSSGSTSSPTSPSPAATSSSLAAPSLLRGSGLPVASVAVTAVMFLVGVALL